MKSQSPCDLEVREIIVENERDLERARESKTGNKRPFKTGSDDCLLYPVHGHVIRVKFSEQVS